MSEEILRMIVELSGMLAIGVGFVWAIKGDTKVLATRLNAVDRMLVQVDIRLAKIDVILEKLSDQKSRIDVLDERLLAQGRRLDEAVRMLTDLITDLRGSLREGR